MPSCRASRDPKLNEFAKLLAEKRSGSSPLVDLTISNPTRAAIPYAREELRGALASTDWLEYSADARGPLGSRQSIARYLGKLGIPSDADRMLLTASTSEAYGYLFKLLCDPGDVVLAPEPGYPLLSELCQYEEVRLEHYQLAYDGAWHIDFASLAQVLERCGSRVRAIVVVSPNNPTGSVLKLAELSRLLQLRVPIISDEVFAAYRLNSVPRGCSVLDIASLDAEESLVFRLDGLSKLAGLPQLKLAFLEVSGEDKRVRESMAALEYIADTYLSVNTPVAYAAKELLALTGPTRDKLQQRLRRNLVSLDGALRGTPTTRLHLEAGWYATLSLPLVDPDADWALALLSDWGLVVQPGWLFDYADKRLIVVSLLTPEADFDLGISLLKQAVNARTA